MDYDFRHYEGQIPMYRQSSSPSPANHPPYAPPPPPQSSSQMYPHIAQSGPTHTANRPFPHPHPHHHNPPPSSSSSAGLGIRVTIKPEYRITPPPQLSRQVGEIPRSNFQFDFDLERRILAEAEKENPNWVKFGMENLPSRPIAPPPSSASVADPVVAKYIASGLSREAVTLGVAHYGDNPTKIREFVNGYNLLREMGFQPKSVAEALVMYENDTDKAIAYFLNGSS